MKGVARLVLLAGAVALGLFLFRATPRDVVLVYDVGRMTGATGLEVELRQDGSVVRRAELRPPPDGGPIRHPVSLRDGTYDLAWRVETPSGSSEGRRTIEVHENGTIVLPLGR